MLDVRAANPCFNLGGLFWLFCQVLAIFELWGFMSGLRGVARIPVPGQGSCHKASAEI